MESIMGNMVIIAQWIPERISQVEDPFYSPEWTWIGIWVASIFTLCIYSFLYKDNPLFKFGEHVYVGLSVGYYICLTWFNVLKPNLFDKILGDFDFYWYLIFPGILGVLMLFRFVRQLTWVSRYPLAYIVAAGAGLSVPAIIQGYLLRQMYGTFIPLWSPGMGFVEFITAIFVVVGVLSVLVYFFFSLEHTGAVGRLSQVGIWFLMITFGASFGYTVMARISLLIGRMQFLLGEWLGLIDVV